MEPFTIAAIAATAGGLFNMYGKNREISAQRAALKRQGSHQTSAVIRSELAGPHRPV